ncbi:hypothetical protein ES288_D11G151300v1 [Gossypium darwinii]|uniref:Uncharacterized protein n=1 Tax=Gossypium darwinii TaxID=34276 RepID=A0A5D2AL50_GOSDA|nr:hypothetical protein ES288_D11G151300v1 [Gossypium darwinii]
MEGTIKGTGAVLFFHVFREVGSQQLCSCTLPSIDQVFFYPGGSFWRCFLFWWNQFLDSY